MLLLQVLNRSETACAIPSDNIGYKLLTKMGWTGGALGKNNDGNVPQLLPLISYDNHVGFGFARPISFTAIRRLIAEYIRSGNHDDLVFSAELTSEEREMILTEARKNHLRSRCYYRGRKDPYVAVSMQRNPLEILNYLLENGGESQKYRLREPTVVQS